MRKFTKILLPVLCVMALLTCTFGSFGAASVSAATASVDKAGAILSKYDVDSWNGMKQVGKVGDGIVTAWDILKIDGYIEGVWIPWLTHSWLGSSLAPNDLESYDNYTLSDGTVKDYWQNMNEVGIDKYDNTQLEMEIFNLRALGFNAMAYAGSPWGEGRVNDLNTWECTGIKEEYLKNVRKFLDICRRAQMPVVWYIHFHSSAVSGYSNLDMWYKIAQVQGHKAYADSFAENFVKPLCQVLAEYRDVVVMCGIADETFNEINDSELGDKFVEGDREGYGVTQEDSMYFHAKIGQMVKQVMPDMPTTCADNADYYAMYGDAMLDMPGRNQYSSGTSPSTSVEEALATGPLMAGEYGMSGSAGAFTEDVWATTMVNKRQAHLDAGYSGFFQWAYEPVFATDENFKPNGNQMITPGGNNPYDLRKGCYQAYYWAESKMNTLGDKTKNITGKPSALYYCGSTITLTSKGSYAGKGKVYWIQPQGQTGYKVERCLNDSGTWTVVANGSGATIDTATGSYRYMITDSSAPSSGTVQYRITVNGKTSYTNKWQY